MRTTLTLDDDQVASEVTPTGQREKSALVREALRASIERESARRQAVTEPRRYAFFMFAAYHSVG